ncbi:MAG: peroxide stress protein YaaA [Bacteroidales bacterium]
MIVILSPAKTLDYESKMPDVKPTQPVYSHQAEELNKVIQPYTPVELAALMKISPQLAMLNYERNQSFMHPATPQRPAVLAFDGDAYEGMDPYSFTKADFEFAQNHLRILSGLYGVLRPLDEVKPYRLEMGIKLPNAHGKNLYEFWSQELTAYFDQLLKNDDGVLINLASEEYSKAINLKEVAKKYRIITPVFKDNRGNGLKVISFLAKKGRGMMTRYIMQNKLTNPEDLKNFELGGYAYSEELSSDNQWIFVR